MLLLGSGRAHAVCASDGDSDGFGQTLGAGCAAVVDCNDVNANVNPGELEDVYNTGDDNCNGRTGMLATLSEVAFSPSQWADVGPIVHLPDLVVVGDDANAAVASTTRTVAVPLNASVVLAIDVSFYDGFGALCDVRLGTSPLGSGSPIVWAYANIPSDGDHLLSFQGLIDPGRTLRKVELKCYGNREVRVDWLQIQDAELIFPPPRDMSLDWQDTRHPIGGAITALARDDRNGNIYMGSDVAGIGRYTAGSGWRVANGVGTNALMAGGMMGVADILPMEDASGLVYALTGDVGAGGTVGGFWRSYDYGGTWEQIGASLYEWPPDTYVGSATTYTTTYETNDDDVAGYALETNCPGSHFDRAWAQGGGRHLVADSMSPAAADAVYIANTDPDAMGVSLWDGWDVCPLPNVGDPLPGDRVGALLRVDAEPNGTPVLVIGYRGRVNSGDAVYVCELPSLGPDCTGLFNVDCQAVTGLMGADVRDMEWDSWLFGSTETPQETGVFIVDGGQRPSETGLYADGIGDEVCDSDRSNLSELFIDDDLGWLTVSVFPDLVTAADLQGIDLTDPAHGTVLALTGTSLDPNDNYVFVNVPVSAGAKYYQDRMYRIVADDLLDPLGAGTVWEALNSGEPTPPYMYEEDFYEAIRHNDDLDLSGAWLEATFNGRADPFPARAAPGVGYDAVWLWTFASGAGSIAAIPGNAVWMVGGLADPWLDNEPLEAIFYPWDTTAQPEEDVQFVFWPNIDTGSHRTYQSTVVIETRIARDGHIWSAELDQALAHLDATTSSTVGTPNGTEIDCLWHGWHAAASSVSIVEPVEGLAPDPVVWATLLDEADGANPQRMGVIRTMDNGTTWNYAGAGWLDDANNRVLSVWDSTDPLLSEYGFRLCMDEETTHFAEPFTESASSPIDPAHAFSQGADAFDARYMSTQSLGNPVEIRALNDRAALVLFQPGEDANGVATGGGFYLTTDGGGTWTRLDFEAGAGACDEDDTYAGASFEFIHPGVDSLWDGDDLVPTDLEELNLDILLSVQAPTASAVASQCSLARVSVQATAATAPATSWSWYTLPYTDSRLFDTTTNACGVNIKSLLGAVPAGWSNEAMIYGPYSRTFNGSSQVTQVYGGACLMDLDSGALKMVVDPRAYAAGIGIVAPHPQVADLWAVLPDLSATTWQECATIGNGPASGTGITALDCPYPYPMVVKGNASGWVTTTIASTYPNTMPLSASWSEIGVPDDSSDSTGSWLVVGTGGSGVWRGEVSW